MVWGRGDSKMAGKKEAVIDASVAVKWFSNEEDTEKALVLRDDHIDGRQTLIAPDLIIYELSNALRFKPGFNQEMVARAINDLLDLQMDLITPSRELISKSSELAFYYDVTIYDSCYIALGELMGIEVYTADRQLYEKAASSNALRLL